MRSVLPERRHVNGHTLLEGAIAETHRANAQPTRAGDRRADQCCRLTN